MTLTWTQNRNPLFLVLCTDLIFVAGNGSRVRGTADFDFPGFHEVGNVTLALGSPVRKGKRPGFCISGGIRQNAAQLTLGQENI